MRVLIIGATSAVAQEMARRFAARGDSLFCVGRSTSKMESLALELGGAVKGRACFDFTLSDSIGEVVTDAKNTLGGIDLAVVAHGLLPDQRVTEVELAAVKETVDVNFTSVVGFLIALSAEMEARGAGKIAVITSVAGDRGRPRNYTYGAAKGALSIYLQGLRSRLYGSGVEVYDFKLGPVVTPMTVNHRKNFSFATTDQVAKEMVAALNHTTYERYVPRFWRPVMWAVRVMPEFVFQRLGFLSNPPDT